MILKLRTADDCVRLVEVSDKTPPRYYVTVLRYPISSMDEFGARKMNAMEPITHIQRMYEYVARLGADLSEYREVLRWDRSAIGG